MSLTHLKKLKRKVSLLVLLTAFADEVGCAQAQQHGDAAADGGILVIRLSVIRQHGHIGAVAPAGAIVFLIHNTTLEQAAALVRVGESGHAQSEDDCDC